MRNLARRIISFLPKNQDQFAPENLNNEQSRDTSYSSPLSFAQQRLWYLDQMMPRSSVHHLPLVVRVSGKLDRSILEQSLKMVFLRHAILRASFKLEKGQPIQIIGSMSQVPLSHIDVRPSTPVQWEEQLRSLIDQQMRTPFDLRTGPLLRATLMQLDEDQHVLVVIAHRTIFDDQSAEIFLHELATFNQLPDISRVTGALSVLPYQYTDFALSQREWIQTEEAKIQLAYWKQQLSNTPSVLQLPTDRPRPAIQSFQTAHAAFQIPETLTEELNKLAQREGMPLFSVLLAAVDTLLFRYTRQEDIVVGTSVPGRSRDEWKQSIGPFENTLALRANLANNPRFIDLLRQVQKMRTDALAHQAFPFERLIEELQPQGDLSYNALFQVMITVQKRSLETRQTAEFSTTPLFIAKRAIPCDIAFTFMESSSKLEGSLAYSTDLFDASTITRLLGHFQHLLTGIVANPEQQIAALPLLPEPERQQLIFGWNDTRTPYPANSGLHQLFEAQVQRTPDAIAVMDEYQGKLTYTQLNEQANLLARYLGTLGVGPEVLVGISLDRSVHIPLCLLAILKAGGAYVPLDPDFPEERIHYMIENAQIRILLTQESVRPRLAIPEYVQTICIDPSAQSMSEYRSDNLDLPVNPDQLAYVLYTSGSTGRPKGVEISQRALVNLLCSMAQEPGLTAGETLLAITTLSFDIAGLDLYLPLLTGACTVIASRDTSTNGRAIARALEHFGITMLQATPVTWRVLVESGWAGKADLVAITGGESLPRDLAEQLLPRVKALYNGYGPTETTIYSTCQHIQSVDEPICIGRPIANTQVYLLDQSLQPVPVGVPGELYIGGDGVARGYLNRPELTQERFLPNRFVADPSARIYRTGDLARYLLDGRIEHLGRLDHQVKIRGFRIELGEVEAALSRSPDIQACVVMAQEDARGNKQLVAYVVAKTESYPTISAIRQFLKEQLPEYMLPSALVCLKEFPLTPNGKIDRKMLPKAENADTFQQRVIIPPGTSTEKRLTEIAAPLLGLEQVSIDDNFFLIGGNSLMGIQFVAQVADAFGIEFPLRTLFENPTVQLLARTIEQIILMKIAEMDENEARSLLEQTPGMV